MSTTTNKFLHEVRGRAIRMFLYHEGHYFEFAKLECADWFNRRGLLAPIGNIPPAEAEANDNAAMDNLAIAA